MKKHTVGLIRVVTLQDKQLLQSHGQVIESLFPEIKVVSRSIPDQPYGVNTTAAEKIAIPKIIALAEEMEESLGIEALIISCAMDPGVIELRRRLNIPVLGAGSAAAHAALSVGDKIGTIGLSEGTPEIMRQILGSSLHTEKRLHSAKTTLELFNKKNRSEIVILAKEIESEGAEALVFTCTGFTTVEMAAELRQQLRIPVIDAVEAVAYCTVLQLRSIQRNGP